MQLGVTESVEVTGVAPILQTQDAVVGEVISEGTIKNMPLNGRNFSQLSLLLPGVVTWNPDGFTDPKGSGRPNVNGQREQANNYLLDGVDMNESVDNTLPYQPNTDALAEVRVDTNNFSAEYGNVAGAVLGSTIKSGTNELHGTAFEYWRDSSLAANSWDNNRAAAQKVELSQNIFGATLGGPIIKNKLFFFVDYQGFLRNRPGDAVTSVAPEAFRRGDLSGVSVHHHRSHSRAGPSRQPDPAEPVQPGRAGDPLRPDLYPLPNRAGDSNNYVSPNSQKLRTHQGDFKLDYNASDKDRLFARVSYQHYTSEPERAPLPSQLAGTNDAPFFGVALNWTRTVSANSVNELLLGFTKVKFQTGNHDWAGIGNANARSASPAARPSPA